MVKSKSKVAIIGSGFVGASTAFAMAMNGLVAEMVLIDVNKDKADGEAMDINHGLAFLSQMSIYSGDYSDVRDCDVIVITAGANRKPGETRLDLAKKNTLIMKEITANVMRYYNQGVILVVSNPVDVMTYMVSKWSGLPEGKVIGSGTVLDSSRFRYLLGEKLGVDVRNVHGYMIGEHGDSQLPVWSATNIAGMQFDEYCAAHNIAVDKEELVQEVKKAGAEVIKRKGATYYAIALSVNRIVEALLKNQSSVLTVGTVVNDSYGIQGVVINLPCIVNKDGVVQVLNIKFTDEELAALQASATQVKAIIGEVREL